MPRRIDGQQEEAPQKPHAVLLADHLQGEAETERDRLIAAGHPFVWLLEIDHNDNITLDSQSRAVYWPVEHVPEWDPFYHAVCSRNDEWLPSKTASRPVPPCLRLQGPNPPPGIAQCASDVYGSCHEQIVRARFANSSKLRRMK